MDIHNEFIAQEKELVFYAGKAVLNKRHAYYDINGDAWDFTDAISYFLNVWEEREGGIQLIAWDDTNLTNSANEIILNAPVADTSIALGKYYYEMGYTVSGGYEVLTNYGTAKFI